MASKVHAAPDGSMSGSQMSLLVVDPAPKDPVKQSRGDQVAKTLNLFVVSESNRGRKVWEFLLFIMLIYIGIIFPYRLAFLHFKLEPSSEECSSYKDPLGWHVWEHIVNWFFWIDLFLNFFLTYRNDNDMEERDVRNIARHYLSRLFVINLIACLPEEAFSPLAYFFSSDGGGCGDINNANKAGRLARLQRATRLARLARLTRLAKIASFVKKDSSIMRFRGFRMCNWIFFLAWVVHLTACAWYLCAALHEEHTETWVARRSIDAAGDLSLLHASSSLQWAHSMYFVLTVFTTVGFGDMSAMTSGEIIMACPIMLLGIVVNSIVIGEVINLVSEVDSDTKWKKEQEQLLEAYGEHASLKGSTVGELTYFVHHGLRTRGRTYDARAVRKMITTEAIPRKLLGKMPAQLFKGLLINNKLITTCMLSCPGGCMPPRFTILLSTMLSSQCFGEQDVVYQAGDNAFNLYLVLSGTFACVGRAKEGGGVDAQPFPDNKVVLHTSTCRRRSVFSSTTPDTKWRTEERFVLNPPGSERKYSSADDWRVFPQLGKETGAWSPKHGIDGPHWMTIDLGTARAVCGVVVQGHPHKSEWVTELKVLLSEKSKDGPWEEVVAKCGACHDGHRETEVIFQVREARYVCIEAVSWHGKPSMRAGVVVNAPKLYPYQVFGRKQFFGHELFMKDTRHSTARCEADGELLQLHKSHVLPGETGGDSLLAEFPQFVRVLRAECMKRDTQRLRALEKFTVNRSFKEFAAIYIQKSWRAWVKGLFSQRRSSTGMLLELCQVASLKQTSNGSPKEGQDAAKALLKKGLKKELERHLDGDFSDLDEGRMQQLMLLLGGSPEPPDVHVPTPKVEETPEALEERSPTLA